MSRPWIAERGSGLTSGEAPQHQPDHADLHLGLARLGFPLVVPAVDPAPAQPGERPFHDPTPLDHPEALAPRRPALDLDHVPAVLGDPPRQFMVLVLVVPPSVFRREYDSGVNFPSTWGAVA